MGEKGRGRRGAAGGSVGRGGYVGRRERGGGPWQQFLFDCRGYIYVRSRGELEEVAGRR